MTTTIADVEYVPPNAAFAAAFERMIGDEPTLTDISAVLYHAARSHDQSVRLEVLCHLAVRALGKFDAWTRYAPPAALKDIVAEALQVCEGPSCDESVAPWDGDVFCSDYCRNEFRRAMGETA